MSKHKHTPGPWRWTESGRLGSVNTAEIRSIAVILNSDGCLVYRDAADGWDDEQAANLALIAAAPELLEALQGVIDLMENWHVLEGTPWMTKQFGDARRAIRKSEGGAV